ncbi:hypothetical protein [Maricaulis sp.]|uniref:hypothetical protein n=1 Tax=Maricaulis sp. TaxID=1486257 RepID=UPI002631C58E|nr:hypothetical protein [Maricaulis sp.]
MIIQSSDARFPERSDQALMITGLLLYIIGQTLLNLGPDFVARQQPIDFAHWSLLIGSVLFLPFIGRLPKRNIHLLTIPLFPAGVAAIIGMCVLDFIFWSLPPGELYRDVVNHLRSTPSIWGVFIVYGPNYIFGTALTLPSLSYWKVSRLGVMLVVGGSLLMAFTGRDWIVQGYILVTAGYFLCFGMLRRR